MSGFLADENVPLTSVLLLRAQGLDVASVREDSPGVEDRLVLDRAVAEHRILVTLDRDFGRLIYREGHAAPVGIVYLRYDGAPGRERPAADLLRLLSDAEALIEGFYVTLHRDLVRRRPLP